MGVPNLVEEVTEALKKLESARSGERLSPETMQFLRRGDVPKVLEQCLDRGECVELEGCAGLDEATVIGPIDDRCADIQPMNHNKFSAISAPRAQIQALRLCPTDLHLPSFRLTGTTLSVGRGPHCGLRLDDTQVSREHARIIYQDERYWLRDLGSTNGTFVSGRRVNYSEIKAGDSIRFGSRVAYDVKGLEAPGGITKPTIPAMSSQMGIVLDTSIFRRRFSVMASAAQRDSADLALIGVEYWGVLENGEIVKSLSAKNIDRMVQGMHALAPPGSIFTRAGELLIIATPKATTETIDALCSSWRELLGKEWVAAGDSWVKIQFRAQSLRLFELTGPATADALWRSLVGDAS